MVGTVTNLDLPRLPIGYSPVQFQVWWQLVVSQIESSINGLNLSIAQLLALEETAAVDSAALTELRARVQQLKNLLAEANDMFGLLAMQIAALQAQDDKARRRADYVEAVAWLL